MSRTVDIAPTLDARLALAVGSGRAELLPTKDHIAQSVEEAGQPTHEAITEWIWFSVELCRLLIAAKWEAAECEEQQP